MPLYLVPGDTVVIDTSRINRKATPFEASVLKVQERPGKANDGRTPQKPLLQYRRLDTGEVSYCDASFATSLIRRSTQPRRCTNIFRQGPARIELPGRFVRNPRPEYLARVYLMPVERVGRSTLCGSLEDLVYFVLAPLNRELTRDLHPERLRELYSKQSAGWIRAGYGTMLVHEKPFRAWVMRNISRIMLTVKEVAAIETENNRRDEATMAADIEADMRRDLEVGFELDPEADAPWHDTALDDYSPWDYIPSYDY